MDLTDDYAIGKYTPGSDAYPAKWAAAAAAFRNGLEDRARLDIPYGSRLRNRFDLFLPDGSAKGLIVFIHGGYWLNFDKSFWSHLAAGPLARGWAVAMPSYTLAPEARITEITNEVATAIDVAAKDIAGRLIITGHSAGGHLSARMRCAGVLPDAVADRVFRVLPISPVGDLRPLTQTDMNTDLRIDAEEAQAESPALIDKTLPTECVVWVGAEERPSFLEQARWLAGAWGCNHHIATGRNHFDVIEDLERPDSPLTNALLADI